VVGTSVHQALSSAGLRLLAGELPCNIPPESSTARDQGLQKEQVICARGRQCKKSQKEGEREEREGDKKTDSTQKYLNKNKLGEP